MNIDPVEMTDTSTREIVTTRLLDAPRELVWKVWTEQEHIEKWWGPNGFTTTTEEMDVRVGGHWQHTMHGPDGVDYPHAKLYQEIKKPERLVYFHGGSKGAPAEVEFTSEVTFEDVDGKTLLTMRMVFSSAEELARVQKKYHAIEGAKQNIDRLAEYVVRIQ
jgi:uncharacterized protein YndB with AHSA1/START domain